MKQARLSRLIIPFFLAGCLIIGYWFYWDKAARQIETQVRAALPATAATSAKVSGFPYRLTLEIKDLNVTAQNGLAFTSSKLVATATPFNPLLWVLEGALDPKLALPAGPARPLKADNLKASLRLHQTGLERFSLTFDGLQAGGVDGWASGKGLFHVMTRFEDDTSFAVVADVSAVRIAKPLEGPGAILGQTISRIFVSGPLSQRQALAKSPQAWREAGGKMTIMAGQIMWGPVALTQAKGELTLSQDDKWQGTIAGQGALKPEGVAVSGLSGPVSLEFKDGRLSLSGLPGINLSDSFR